MTTYDLFDDFLYRIPGFTNKKYTHPDECISSDFFKEAVYLASTNLYDAVFSKDTPESLSNIPAKQRWSIVKYLNRMCTRSTPFGNFASVGIGKITDKSTIVIDDDSPFTSVTSLNNEFFISLSKEVEKSAQLSDLILYYPNSSLYQSGNRLRYIERREGGLKDDLLLSSIEYSKAVKGILAVCRRGLNKSTIAQFIVSNNFSETIVEAELFVDSLISNQILINEFYPGITSDNLKAAKLKLDKYANEAPLELSDYFKACVKKIGRINDLLPGKRVDSIIDLELFIKQHNMPLANNNARFTKSNLYTRAEASSVGKNITELLKEGIKVLNMLQKNNLSKIENFKTLFFERYEHEEIPFTEALDPDVGIGFGNYSAEFIRKDPILKSIVFKTNSASGENHIARTSTEVPFLLKKYIEYVEGKHEAIELGRNDFKHCTENWDNLPLTFSAGIEVIRAGNNSSPLIYLRFAGGYSANAVLGRFTADCDDVRKLATQIEEFESRNTPDGAVMAELACMPDEVSHSNLLTRASIYKYEIPILSNLSVASDHQILMSDLYLSIDENQSLILRSKKLGKRIIPRNSTADAFHVSSNPYYHFLTAMQSNGNLRSGINYDFKNMGITNGFYPRVIYENKIILSPATWQINFHVLNQGDRFNENLIQLRQELKIPDKVYSTSGDNKLLVDFTLPGASDILKTELKKGNIFIEEYFDDNSDPLIVAGKEVYNNELLFFLFKN